MMSNPDMLYSILAVGAIILLTCFASGLNPKDADEGSIRLVLIVICFGVMAYLDFSTYCGEDYSPAVAIMLGRSCVGIILFITSEANFGRILVIVAAELPAVMQAYWFFKSSHSWREAIWAIVGYFIVVLMANMLVGDTEFIEYESKKADGISAKDIALCNRVMTLSLPVLAALLGFGLSIIPE